MKVLLADDQDLFRECLAASIAVGELGFQVTQVSNWLEVHQSANKDFTLMLVDLSMPSHQEWQQDLHQLCSSYQGVPVCAISANLKQTTVQAAFSTGIRGYISKSTTLKAVQEAIELVLSGNIYFPAEIFNRAPPPTKTLPLTDRQQHILGFVTAGRSNKEIARQLGLSEGTVKRHIYNIYKILGVRNRVEAAQCCKVLSVVND